MKKLLSVMLLALLLTGCGGEEKTTTICKGNIDESLVKEKGYKQFEYVSEIGRAHV